MDVLRDLFLMFLAVIAIGLASVAFDDFVVARLLRRWKRWES